MEILLLVVALLVLMFKPSLFIFGFAGFSIFMWLGPGILSFLIGLVLLYGWFAWEGRNQSMPVKTTGLLDDLL